MGERNDVTSAPLLADAGPDRVITEDELRAHIEHLAAEHVLATGARRVLLVPPDHTRLHSRAGLVTGLLYEHLAAHGVEAAVLPALGTHAPMRPANAAVLFGDRVPFDRLLVHRWRDDVVLLGEIDASVVAAVSAGRLDLPIPVAVNRTLVEGGWDLVVSVGQVVPHEVIGMANFTKNLVIGLGGAPTVHRTHFLGALCGLESIMGRADTPVRAVVDAAFDRFVAPRVDVLWVLTVMQDTGAGVLQRGLFAGRAGTGDSGGAAYRAAVALAAAVNVVRLPARVQRMVCWLDPDEFHSTWLGNKAVYRTRLAIADGGELIVLAPGVRTFGEDLAMDALIRRHGYRGTPACLAAVAADPELADNLGAAAHLVHGSSEGRFTITYCTDPDAGGLTRAEVEAVGYRWRSLRDEQALLGIDAATPDGTVDDLEGNAFHFVRNPALGLWMAPEAG